MHIRFRKRLFAALLAAGISPLAGADVIFIGSGTGEAGGAVSASATFSFDGVDTLTLLLAATTTTEAQGDALTGILFSIGGAQTLSFDMTGPTCGQTLPAGSVIWTSDTTSNTTDPLCGSWTNVRAAAPPIAGEFGVATTGFGGNFNGGTITLGNSSPNYGIVGPASFPAPLPSDFGGSSFPFIQSALQFEFTLTSGTLAEADITGVTFLFGTRGTDTAPGIPERPAPVPEPGSLALLGLGLAGLAWFRRRA